jgi:hypothetical protein
MSYEESTRVPSTFYFDSTLYVLKVEFLSCTDSTIFGNLNLNIIMTFSSNEIENHRETYVY